MVIEMNLIILTRIEDSQVSNRYKADAQETSRIPIKAKNYSISKFLANKLSFSLSLPIICFAHATQ